MCREVPEAKSLRWLANQFPLVDNPKDDVEKMNNCIHLYCTAGADALDKYNEKLELVMPIVDSLASIATRLLVDAKRIALEESKQLSKEERQ